MNLSVSFSHSASIQPDQKPFPFFRFLKKVAFIAFTVFSGGQAQKNEEFYHAGMPFDGEKGFDGQNAQDTWEGYVTSAFRDIPHWTAHEFNYERTPGGPDGIYMHEIPKAHRSNSSWPVYDITESGTYDYPEADCTIRLPYNTTSLQEDPDLKLLREESSDVMQLTKPLYLRCGRITVHNDLYSKSNVILIATGLGRSLCNDDPICYVPLKRYDEGEATFYVHKNQISRSGDLLIANNIGISAENLFVVTAGKIRLQEAAWLVGKQMIALKPKEGIERNTGAYLQPFQEKEGIYWNQGHDFESVEKNYQKALYSAAQVESSLIEDEIFHENSFSRNEIEKNNKHLNRPLTQFESDIEPNPVVLREAVLSISRQGVYIHDGPCVIEDPKPLPRRNSINEKKEGWYGIQRRGALNILAGAFLYVDCHSIHVRTHIFVLNTLFFRSNQGDIVVDPDKRISATYHFILANRSFYMTDRSLLKGHGAIAVLVQNEVHLNNGMYDAKEGVSKEDLEKEYSDTLEILAHPEEALSQYQNLKKRLCRAYQEWDLAQINKVSTQFRMFFVKETMSDATLFELSNCYLSDSEGTKTLVHQESLIPSLTGRLQVKVSKDKEPVIIEMVKAPLINSDRKISILVLSQQKQRYIGSDLYSLGNAIFFSRSSDVQFLDSVYGYHTKKRTFLRGTVKTYHEKRRPTNVVSSALAVIAAYGKVQFESSNIYANQVNIEAVSVDGCGGKEIFASKKSHLIGKKQRYSERILPFTITADQLNIVAKSLRIANFIFTVNRFVVSAEKMSLDREIERHFYKKIGLGAGVSVGVLPLSLSMDSTNKKADLGLPFTNAGSVLTTKGNDPIAILLSAHALAHEINQFYEQIRSLSLFSLQVSLSFESQKFSFQTLGPGLIKASEITFNVALLDMGGGVEILADKIDGKIAHMKKRSIQLEQKTKQARFSLSAGLNLAGPWSYSFSLSKSLERDSIPPSIEAKQLNWEVGDEEDLSVYKKETFNKAIAISRGPQGQMIALSSLKNHQGKNYLIDTTHLADDFIKRFEKKEKTPEKVTIDRIEKKQSSNELKKTENDLDPSHFSLSAGVKACYHDNVAFIQSVPDSAFWLMKETFAPDYQKRTEQLTDFVQNTAPKLYQVTTSKVFWENRYNQLLRISDRVLSLSKNEFKEQTVYWSSRIGCEIVVGGAVSKTVKWGSQIDQVLKSISRIQMAKKLSASQIRAEFGQDRLGDALVRRVYQDRVYSQMHPAHHGVKWLGQKELARKIDHALSETAYSHTTTIQNALSIIKDKTIYPSHARLGWGVWVSTRFEPNFGDVAFLFDRKIIENLEISASKARALGTGHFWAALAKPLSIDSAKGVIVLNRVGQIEKSKIKKAVETAGIGLIDSSSFFKVEKIREKEIGIMIPKSWEKHTSSPLEAKTISQKNIPQNWLGSSSAQLKKGTVLVAEDQHGKYLSLHIDGLYANGNSKTLSTLLFHIKNEAEMSGVNRIYLITEFRNQRIKDLLTRKFRLKVIEENIGNGNTLYSVFFKSPINQQT